MSGIVAPLRTKEDDLSDDDVSHMRTVVGHVRRHLAQQPDAPDAELAESRWAASLRTCGHDPLTA